jgi:hypothetical protein
MLRYQRLWIHRCGSECGEIVDGPRVSKCDAYVSQKTSSFDALDRRFFEESPKRLLIER